MSASIHVFEAAGTARTRSPYECYSRQVHMYTRRHVAYCQLIECECQFLASYSHHIKFILYISYLLIEIRNASNIAPHH